MTATLASLAQDLEAGRTTAVELVETCLAAIRKEGGEGRAAFVQVNERALDVAHAMDGLRRAGNAPSRFAGIPVSVKDLFDAAGEVTRAGSIVRSSVAPAGKDATVISRLRRMGFILIGRTNMSEFAYSGLGLNPHYGTPKSVFERNKGRAPGGSSSGAAVSVADGMAHAALGTDTGGSCRIPAAFNRLVGFKPTAERIPRDGVVPLSTTLDSVGPLARSVGCCAALDSILAGFDPLTPEARSVEHLRIAVPATVALDNLEPEVASGFETLLQTLSRAGADIVEVRISAFSDALALQANGGFAAAESYAFHRGDLREKSDMFDPRVLARIGRGANLSAADYIDLGKARSAVIERASLQLSGFDAVLMPTVPIIPPLLRVLEVDEEFGRLNALVLRNSSLVNLIDGCAVSLPAGSPYGPPVGVTIAGLAGDDRRILAISAGIEKLASTSD
ncbi:amidase [Bradyrhizobium sp. 149]|uniref:amidase n=1 Tax=Bradyrhizobium sp. 149 TaxID=2782624 RepID=UPI001FF8D42B|nr:amidase [Bradyrhizobium sp. 149]MCK1655319.1 amidase [Bradyrhizobium sp. 149]